MNRTVTFFRMALVAFVLLTLTLIVLSAATSPVLAMAPGDDTQPQAFTVPPVVVLLITSGGFGALGYKITNWLKVKLNWVAPTDKTKNVWLAFGVSAVIAVPLLLLTQSLVPITGPETLVTWAGMLFATATLIYQSINPAAEPESPQA